jgi:PAS domain S-box-containing protein
MAKRIDTIGKVLAVDDLEDHLALMDLIFKQLMPGVTFLSACTAKEGIALAINESPDVIVLDIHMPDMDGLKVCKVLKVHEETRHIPIIIFTGVKSDSRSRVKAFENGADAFLVKPIDQTELAAQVNAMLRIKKAEDQLREEKNQLKSIVYSKTKELKSSHQLFLDIFNNVNDAIFIHDLNDDFSPGVFVEVNNVACCWLGYSREEFLKMSPRDINSAASISPLPDPVVMEEMKIHGQSTFERGINSKDGRIIPVEISAYISSRKDKKRVISILRDITERKKIEEDLKRSLKEKELLLKETHHRIKNNLAMVSSLLNIQSSHMKNNQLIDAMADIRTRIQSIALIHERLHQSEDLYNIELNRYFQALVTELLGSFSLPDKIVCLDLDVQEYSLEAEKAIPLGLIITEIITNSLKYGIRENQPITLTLHLNVENQCFIIKAGDNGIGIDPDLDWRNTNTLGLQLLNLLVQQLGGSIDLDRSDGTIFNISFPIPR